MFVTVYYRFFVNTMYLSVGNLVFFIFIYAVGFAFVEVVNLQNERGNPFIGRDGTYKDIKWNIAIAFIMYMFAGMVTLR